MLGIFIESLSFGQSVPMQDAAAGVIITIMSAVPLQDFAVCTPQLPLSFIMVDGRVLLGTF
jgi:hypothetical protein